MILCLPFVIDMCLFVLKLFVIMHFDVSPPFLYLWAFVFPPFPFMPRSVIHPLQVSFCLCFFLCQAFLSRAGICCLVFHSHQLPHMGSIKWIWSIPTSLHLTLSLLFTATGFEVEGRILPLEHTITLEEWKWSSSSDFLLVLLHVSLWPGLWFTLQRMWLMLLRNPSLKKYIFKYLSAHFQCMQLI